MSFLNDRRGKL